MKKRILYADSIKINDAISIRIPTVGEVWDKEDDFNVIVSSVISTPYDMMVQLDEAGIDFTTISSFELFCMLINGLGSVDTSIVFGDLEINKYKPAINEVTKELVLLNSENGTVIDKAIHEQISSCLKKMLQIKKEPKKPGNEEGKKYMIRIAKINQRRQRRIAEKRDTSQLEDMIISLVNTAEFPYDYESVKNISIYQLYQSVNQIAHKITFDNTMHGYYAGTIKREDLKREDMTWFKP